MYIYIYIYIYMYIHIIYIYIYTNIVYTVYTHTKVACAQPFRGAYSWVRRRLSWLELCASSHDSPIE